eukprot:COSAG02_NODE_11604_length_1690_cov_11.712689_2_plen_193_part_00
MRRNYPNAEPRLVVELTHVSAFVITASNTVDDDIVMHADPDNQAVNDSLGSLCDRMENLVMKDDTLMSHVLDSSAQDDHAAFRSPVWPASPGQSPVQSDKSPPGTPLQTIGGKIPSLRPSPGSLAMTGTPPSAKRSPSRAGRRNRSRVGPSKPLSTRTDGVADISTQHVPINMCGKPPRSAKKSKQRRYRLG